MCFQMSEGETTPPSLLTEADLIALMDKHGIGKLTVFIVPLVSLVTTYH